MVPLEKGAMLRIALVYPNRYAVGMASLGFQTVYRIWNEQPGVRCERAFATEGPAGEDIRTLESDEPLRRFDIVGFSVSFELDIPNVIRALLTSRIPLLATDRTDKDPFILVGGAVASLNPSPLLPFIDGLQAGEGEDLLQRIAEVFTGQKRSSQRREKILVALSELEGIFIPSMQSRVKRHVLASLEEFSTYTPIVSPFSHFKNMFVVETGRGCTRGCFFCAGQKISFPYRFRSVESVAQAVADYNPGAARIGLEGVGISDYPGLEDLCRHLLDEGYRLSFSSLRPDRVTREFVGIIERSGIKTFTMAPEAGTERLRGCIGKGIMDDVLMRSCRLLSETGVETLKLYFLIGLPGERDEDVDAMVRLVKAMAEAFRVKGRKKTVRVSVNAFVPKPFTEFQWAPMSGSQELSSKRRRIQDGLHGVKGVVISKKSVKEELFQGVLSLGDAQAGLAVADMVRKARPWKQALKEKEIDVNHLLHRARGKDERFSWEFIDATVPREKLWERYQSYPIHEQNHSVRSDRYEWQF